MNSILISTVSLALLATPFATACGGCDGDSGKQSASKNASDVKSWTCSMHPEVKSPKQGKCPVCGMKLIPAKGKTSAKKGS